MSREEEINRGRKAEILLNDETLLSAKAEVERVIHEAWANAPLRDKEGAHELKLMLKALSDVWALLERAVADGKLSAEELRLENARSLSPADFRALYLTR